MDRWIDGWVDGLACYEWMMLLKQRMDTRVMFPCCVSEQMR